MKRAETEQNDQDLQDESKQRSRLLEVGIVIETVYVVVLGLVQVWHIATQGAAPVERRLLNFLLFVPVVSLEVFLAVMCWKLSVVALWVHVIGSVWIVFSRGARIIEGFFSAPSDPSTLIATAPYLVQPLIIVGCILSLRKIKHRKKRERQKSLMKGLDPPSDESEKPNTESGEGTEWYYLRAGEKKGPFKEEDMAEAIRSDRVEADTFVWRKGMPDWVHADSTNLVTYL